MPGHFTYTFESQLPTDNYQLDDERYQGKPLLEVIEAEAHKTITAIKAFQELPERNQKLVLDMAGYAIKKSNRVNGTWCNDGWRENFWGLYVVGSRARGEEQPDSDLDLLSVGTFYRSQSFSSAWTDRDTSIFKGFDLEYPEELPSEYNVGDVDRKYLIRATPTTEGVLSVDLSVVDLTFIKASLESFKETKDIAEDGSELPRVPIFELTVPRVRDAIYF